MLKSLQLESVALPLQFSSCIVEFLPLQTQFLAL